MSIFALGEHVMYSRPDGEGGTIYYYYYDEYTWVAAVLVLAYRRGSIPEIIEDGVTGFICDSLSDMVAAIDRLPQIQRRRCRDSFEARFTVQRMAEDYLALYEQMAAVATRPRAFVNGRSLRMMNGGRMTATGLATPHGTA